MRPGLNELEPNVIFNNESTLEEIVVLQRDMNNNSEAVDEPVFREHLTDLTMINTSGRCQLTNEISVHAEAETTIKHIERELIPKSVPVLMDYNDAGFFKYRIIINYFYKSK